MHGEQQQVQRDVVEHDAGEDFVGVERRLQPGAEPGPGGAAQRAEQQGQHQCPARIPVDDVDRQCAAGQGTDEQLAFGANVPDARVVDHSQAQRAEQDRQRLDQQF